MRLHPIVFSFLLLLVLPAAADWERLQPETAAPAVITPAPDAVCREQARRLDERTRQTADVAAAGGGAASRISADMGTDRHWYVRHCFWPRACPAAAMVRPQSDDGTVTGPYERILRLCGQ